FADAVNPPPAETDIDGLLRCDRLQTRAHLVDLDPHLLLLVPVLAQPRLEGLFVLELVHLPGIDLNAGHGTEHTAIEPAELRTTCKRSAAPRALYIVSVLLGGDTMGRRSGRSYGSGPMFAALALAVGTSAGCGADRGDDIAVKKGALGGLGDYDVTSHL